MDGSFVFKNLMPSGFFPGRHANDAEIDVVLMQPVDVFGRSVDIIANQRRIHFILVAFKVAAESVFTGLRIAAQTLIFGFNGKKAFGMLRIAADEGILFEKDNLGAFFGSLYSCGQAGRTCANNHNISGDCLLSCQCRTHPHDSQSRAGSNAANKRSASDHDFSPYPLRKRGIST